MLTLSAEKFCWKSCRGQRQHEQLGVEPDGFGDAHGAPLKQHYYKVSSISIKFLFSSGNIYFYIYIYIYIKTSEAAA